jgi:hypothetical protein
MLVEHPFRVHMLQTPLPMNEVLPHYLIEHHYKSLVEIVCPVKEAEEFVRKVIDRGQE